MTKKRYKKSVNTVEGIDNLPFDKVKWRGFTASLTDLIAEGWQVYVEYNLYTKIRKYRLREPKSAMLVSIAVPEEKAKPSNETVNATAMLQEHNGRITPPKELSRRALTPDDVPELLQIIQALQEPEQEKLRKKQPKKTSNVINIADYIAEYKRENKKYIVGN